MSKPTAFEPGGHDSTGPQVLCGALAPLVTEMVFWAQLETITEHANNTTINDARDELLLLLLLMAIFVDVFFLFSR